MAAKIILKFKNFLRPYLPQSWVLVYHKIRAILAAYWYRFPSRRLVVIGVTGTNGKTTTCQMIAKILEEAGFTVGMATTLNFKVGKKEWVNETKMTTVSPFILQKLLREMVDGGCRFAVIETTSHALSQFRVWGIHYAIVALTNITHDHYDYHRTYEEYREAKLKLFKFKHAVSVVNADDKASELFLDQPAFLKLSYGLENRAKITARKIIAELGSTLFTLVTPQGQIAIDLKLPGRFNLYNALAAASVALSQKISLETIKSALEKMTTIPGRMEEVVLDKAAFKVVVDFAHTPDALHKVYETLRPYCRKNLIAVLGATGERDKSKRPILGALAGRYADIVIITNEDPYHENPAAIMEQVAAGVPRGREKTQKAKIKEQNFFIIEDRAEAIRKALSLARPQDCLIITGKGGERYMMVGEEKLPWDERQVVINQWQKLQKNKQKL